MREEIVSGVEELTGRRVIAFLSDSRFESDLAVGQLLHREPVQARQPSSPR
jgi:hypothetical protein